MKRFTMLFTLIGALAILAVFQAWSEARAEANAPIAQVNDSADAASDAIRPEAAPSYRAVLGKSLKDKELADFVASNNCSSAAQFQLCQDAGVALWMDENQRVNTVYLYAISENGFAPYAGALPFGINATDRMEEVQEKLGQPVNYTPLWEPGLPDSGSSPDHQYFWAVYERFGMTIIYNTPFANDKDASIHAVLVSE